MRLRRRAARWLRAFSGNATARHDGYPAVGVPVTKRLARILDAAPTAAACLVGVGSPELVGDLAATGVTREQLLLEARHQADLLGHPYVAPEHVRLAALRLLGRREPWKELSAALSPALPGGRWRPRGLRSAARRRGRELTARRQAEAAARERGRAWPLER